jgi:hypothetical protein
VIIYMWHFPDSFGERVSHDSAGQFQGFGWRNGRWLYHAPPEHPWFDHDHNPIWGRSMLLGAFIASGGWN